MDVDLFQNLSRRDAAKFLTNYLNEASKGFSSMISPFASEAIIADYSKESLLSIFKIVSKKLITNPVGEDSSLPIWIRNTDSYKKGLYIFDSASNILILRYSFYFGDWFVRSFDQLSWSIGRRRTAVANMPVVSGFKMNIELAPMLVCKNLFASSVEESSFESVEIAINYWISLTTF